MALLIVGLLAGPARGQSAAPASGGHFVVETNPFLIGQAPDWIDDEHIVWHDPVVRDEGGDGQTQVYRSRLDGSDKVCLTCTLPGPNQVAVAQPGGDWILFHSWGAHQARIGGPGFGGIGSEIWVMRKDGTQHTNLTRGPELTDNFHAYWSPDGQHIVWTALDWTLETGNGRSDIRVARFDPNGPDGPRLVDVHVVRPGNGHWYETQWWAPDGSGFLYTETSGTAINTELYFCRLADLDRSRCQRVRLTRDLAWDEQAIFTPDMNRVLFMSSRHLPGAHNDWSQVAALLDLPASFDYVIVLTVFSDSFLQPILQQATDLYELQLDWNHHRTMFKAGKLRRLTSSGVDAWVIPEFAYDPSGTRLLWTQNKFRHRVDQACVTRRVRADYIARLREVSRVNQIPFGIADEMREQAAALLRHPSQFAFEGLGCGGENQDQEPKWEQQTKIGRFVP